MRPQRKKSILRGVLCAVTFLRHHRMIENNRLVVKISLLRKRGLALLDLIEEGNLGLIRAMEKFDRARFPASPLCNLVDPSDD